MPLKKLKVKLNEKAPTGKKDEIPSYSIEGKSVGRYNHIVAQLKDLEAEKAQIRADLIGDGATLLFERNCAIPNAPTTSIKLEDEEGQIARLSFTEKYSAANPEAVEAVFESLGKDINEYAQETVKASFNSDVFLDKDGNFSEATYNAFKKAIDVVAAKLRVESPLASKTLVLPKPSFHARRWTDFNAEQNAQLLEVLPNAITVTPVKE